MEISDELKILKEIKFEIGLTLKKLRELRDSKPFPVRSKYNEICDRIDVVESKLKELHADALKSTIGKGYEEE